MKVKTTPSKQHPYYRLAAFRIAKTPLLQNSNYSPKWYNLWGGGAVTHKPQPNRWSKSIFRDRAS